jgi:hypothetical protein
MRSLLFLSSISITIFACLSSQVSWAEDKSQPRPSEAPLELELLEKSSDLVITANTIYQDRMAVPSFWWAKENAENKLLDNWIAYPASVAEPARVDLVVNQQIWSLLDYLERYNFVNQMGNLARSYGYNVRVFNYQQESLATYTCNFANNSSVCNIDMNNKNNMGLESSS